MRDLGKEIWSTVSNNKLRTALTGFAVSWGIFLLICLLGAGNGLMNSFMGNVDDFVQNSIRVNGWRTSLPYSGYKEGRWVRLDDKDVEMTASGEFSGNVDLVAPITGASRNYAAMGDKSVNIFLEGVTPSFQKVEKVNLERGRFINELDIREARKCVVINSNIEKELTANSGNSLLGRWINIGGMSFRVIGICSTDESDLSSWAYLPFTTMRAIFSPGTYVDRIFFTFHGLKTKDDNTAFEKRYSDRLKSRHSVHPDDNSAFWIWNRYTGNIEMTKAQNILRTALWILGLLTLVSGIVGVSNIMLISVKERTHEFGIRKAIGARPSDILKLIISESVTITAFFGYIGMILGMLACEIMDKTIGKQAVDIGFTQIHMLKNPTVGLDVALEATLLLIIAGTIAGIFPARKASRVRPIEALRAE